MTNLHDDFGMPFHDTVLEVEPFNIADCCRFYHLWKAEAFPTDPRYLRTIKVEKQKFIVDCKISCGWWWVGNVVP